MNDRLYSLNAAGLDPAGLPIFTQPEQTPPAGPRPGRVRSSFSLGSDPKPAQAQHPRAAAPRKPLRH